MVTKTWRVRFAPPRQPNQEFLTATATDQSKPGTRRNQPKSKSACQICRSRRVKCDETYPVCRRCDDRGVVCIPAPRKTIWKLELPFLISQAIDTTPLLQYWFENVCHMMVPDPELNPWALPLLDFLKNSMALLHVVQSVAAAHKTGFGTNDGRECLIQRQQTIYSVQQELSHPHHHSPATFLAIFLLGISSPWIEGTSDLNHLLGAKAVLEEILHRHWNNLSDPSIQLILGLYTWWDMASSFGLDYSSCRPIDPDIISKAIDSTHSEYHCMAGYSSELFYLLGNVNRYCRAIAEGETRELALEVTLQEQLMDWKPTGREQIDLVGDTYRKHGLILLRRVCGPQPDEEEHESEDKIRQLAAEAMYDIQKIPLTSSFINIQPIPLMSAASEIPPTRADQREAVKKRFRAIYSINRLQVMLDAIALLEEIWELRPLGITTSWLVISHEQGQNLYFA
ncbi:hypothetical protein FSARC_92 [Fusarium sarcochroum]|uniref:Zn(2)-C6 fungal-type domain-containing protein n=1 Tax=Fusarium sarcochroum TaxID=1208366 RepID=A0A8H4UCZ7_9HYPO|nr:hypothetical protein FSARC_92 [Fusarium sarcochroum]